MYGKYDRYIPRIFKRINCSHTSIVFIKNLFGDNINRWSYGNKTVRSLWRCRRCGKIIRSGDLYLKACYLQDDKKERSS